MLLLIRDHVAHEEYRWQVDSKAHCLAEDNSTEMTAVSYDVHNFYNYVLVWLC